MSVPATTPVPWVESTVDTTAPSSVDSLIRSWLNQNGFDDLTELSPQHLQQLITFLSRHTAVSGVNALLTQLRDLQADWKASGKSEDKLSNEIDELKLQQRFLTILAKSTTGQDGLDQAKQSVSSKLTPLEEIKRAVLEGSLPLDQDSGPQTEASTVALLEKLEALGVDQLEALGLLDLFNSLTTALSNYRSALAAAGGDQTKINMAGSEFRQDVAMARKAHLLSTGLSDSHGLVQREQNTIESEDVYQDYLATPMDENWKADAPGITAEDIQSAYDEAHRMYKDAEARGDQDTMNFFRERMTILRTAVDALNSGEENPFIVIVRMYISLLNLDIMRLKNLKVRALAADNQDLASRIQERMDTIGQLIQEIMKGQVKLLQGVENSMASIRT